MTNDTNNNYPESGNSYSGNHYQQQGNTTSNVNPGNYSNQSATSSNGNFVAQPSNVRGNKIYIGNLNYELDTPDLKEAFSSYGEIIDVVVIKDKESNCSRGFGFVTFASHSSAREALNMHGQELNGRRMRVKLAEAKPQQRQTPFIFTGEEEVF